MIEGPGAARVGRRATTVALALEILSCGQPAPSIDATTATTTTTSPAATIATTSEVDSASLEAAMPVASVTSARASLPTSASSTSATPSGATATGTEPAPLPSSPGSAEVSGAAPPDPARAEPCPPDMALVERTCVDRHEAHLVVRADDGSISVHPHHERPPSDRPFEARSAAGVFPQAYLSRKEADRACTSAGKRLCSYDEWRRACRGRAGHFYPYGAKGVRGACNSSKPHLLPQLFGGNARVWKYDEHFNSPLLNQKDGYLARSGAFSDCESREGVFDLVGNLHEWVSGTVTTDFVERLDLDKVERRKQPWRVGNAIFVGGFYSTGTEHGPGCMNVTIAHEPRYHDYSTGFRCCKSANLPAPPKARPPKRKPR